MINCWLIVVNNSKIPNLHNGLSMGDLQDPSRLRHVCPRFLATFCGEIPLNIALTFRLDIW